MFLISMINGAINKRWVNDVIKIISASVFIFTLEGRYLLKSTGKTYAHKENRLREREEPCIISKRKKIFIRSALHVALTPREK